MNSLEHDGHTDPYERMGLYVGAAAREFIEGSRGLLRPVDISMVLNDEASEFLNDDVIGLFITVLRDEIRDQVARSLQQPSETMVYVPPFTIMYDGINIVPDDEENNREAEAFRPVRVDPLLHTIGFRESSEGGLTLEANTISHVEAVYWLGKYHDN